jgi:predicted O-methyltransferase YrrM
MEFSNMPARSWMEKLALKLLRRSSPHWRARTELFMDPYRQWVDWSSGLGEVGRILYAMTRVLKPSVIVEIGSARGYSTCCFSLACAENGTGMVYAIDPHMQNEWTDVGTQALTLNFLKARLSDYGLDPYCTVMRMTSGEAAASWSKKIDLIFIDGDHTLAGVRQDFEGFQRFLNPEGFVLFHDSAWEHDQPWTAFAGENWYREDMGVPAYLEGLQKSGYESVTFGPVPGLTIMHPRHGGYEFLRRGGLVTQNVQARRS